MPPKHLKSEHITLQQLSLEEKQLRNSKDNAEIYEFLLGEKDSIPKFQFHWISPKAPAICWPPQFQPSDPPLIRDKPVLAPPPPQQPILQPPPAPFNELPNQQLPEATPTASPSVHGKPPVPLSDTVLCDKKYIDYSELHTGIKKKCKSLCRKAQALVTRLAPGEFSPKSGGPSTSTSQQ